MKYSAFIPSCSRQEVAAAPWITRMVVALIAIILCMGNARAQNVGIGTNTPVNKLSVAGKANITDSLGIGTTTPAARLDVLGNVKITDGSQAAGKVLKSDANGLSSWGALTGTDILTGAVPVATNSCPVVVGSVATGTNPYSVAVSGNYAYVVNYGGNNMQVIDISNPASPAVVGLLPGLSVPQSITVSGNYAYVAERGSNKLQVINISNPTSPSFAGWVVTGLTPWSVVVSGTYAYVVNATGNTMAVINISNPASPVFVGSVATSFSPYSIAVSGNYAYVVCGGSNTMQVINITNPAAPAVVGSVGTTTNPILVTISGNYAYVVTSGSNILHIYNITIPTSPVLVKSVVTGNQPNSVAVSGNYAYVVNAGSNTMQVINITNAASAAVVSSVTTGNVPYSVAVSGNYAYLVNSQSNNLQSINLLCSVNYAITYNPATGQTSALPLQWNTSGNDIGNANTGNVGIGTATPANKLSVTGNMDITGNMGIGTSSPSSALDIAGALRVGNNQSTHSQGAYLEWNKNAGDGGTWLLNQKGLGTGGFIFGEVDNSNTVSVRMAINSSGLVGIGTTSPGVPLDVNGSQLSGNVSGYVFGSSSGTGTSYTGQPSTSIRASGTIIGLNFLAVSDGRVKKVIGLSDAQNDLATLNKIRVTDYRYIDQLANGNGVSKKVIAQELEAVLPAAVSKGVNFIPDIYAPASTEASGGKLRFTLQSAHGLHAGDKVKWFDEKNALHQDIVTEIINGNTFSISYTGTAGKAFVYGREVRDFRTVDYEAITTLNVSATQELYRMIQKLKEENETLRTENNSMKEDIRMIKEKLNMDKQVTKTGEK